MTENNITREVAKALHLAESSTTHAACVTAEVMLGSVLKEKYRITGVLAEGGMGRIYTAEHISLSRKFAVKVVLPELSAHAEIVKRFRLEAQLCAQLSHPNVVSLLDFGQRSAAEGGELYAVMELVEGPTLEEMLGHEVLLDFRRLAGLMEQLLIALEYAHENGVVHRDVKPANVVVQTTESGAERVKLIDFGIAQAQLNAGRRSAIVSGTPEYMAPEQALGAAASASVDIYAAGVVLFQLLTGRVPFFGTSVSQILGRHLTTDRPDPRLVAPERNIPEAFASACMRAMALEPDDRFQTAADFADALVRARRELSSKALQNAEGESTGARQNTPRPPPLASKAPRMSSRYSVSSGVRPRTSSPSPSLGELLAPRVSSDERLVGQSLVLSPPDPESVVRLLDAADAFLRRGETERALAVLLEGLKSARDAVLGGERELGQVAIRTFSIKLATVYEGLAQNELRRNVLFGALNFFPATEPGRAVLLKHLMFAEHALHNPGRAEQLRVEAHALALRHGDGALASELSALVGAPVSGTIRKYGDSDDAMRRRQPQ